MIPKPDSTIHGLLVMNATRTPPLSGGATVPLAPFPR